MYFFQGIRCGSKFLHFATRQNRFLAGSILKFQNKMVVMRLMWALQNIPGKQRVSCMYAQSKVF